MGATRRKILTGFALVAVPLLCASVAYACTVYKGSFTVTLSGAGVGSQTVYGDASMTAPQMFWCTQAGNGAGVPDPDPLWTQLSMPHNTNTQISISTGDATSYDPQCVSQTNATNDIGLNRIRTGSGYDLDWHAGLMPGGGTVNHNCHSGQQQHSIANNITVTNGATGPHTFTFKSTGSGPTGPGFISVCLYDDNFRPDAAAVNIAVL